MGLSKVGRSAVMGVAAGILYGLWAVHANWSHELVQVARAAAVQFALSFCSTSVLTVMIELVLARGRRRSVLILAVVGPHVAMTSAFLTVHWAVGTPHVLKTAAPSIAVGLAFCIAYVLKRSRPSEHPTEPGGPR